MIDLATLAERVVFRTQFDVPNLFVRHDLVTFVEQRPDGTVSWNYRVFLANWRTRAAPELIDDFAGESFGGGDTWLPLPAPQTDGSAVVWLHWQRGAVDGELMVRGADGTRTSIMHARRALLFALADDRRVAISSLPFASQGQAELSLWGAGVTRSLATKATAGSVAWSEGKVAWADGLGLTTGVSSLELVDVDTAARRGIRSPKGCALLGVTVHELLFGCERYLVAREEWTPFDGGPVHVFPHAILAVDGTVTRIP